MATSIPKGTSRTTYWNQSWHVWFSSSFLTITTNVIAGLHTEDWTKVNYKVSFQGNHDRLSLKEYRSEVALILWDGVRHIYTPWAFFIVSRSQVNWRTTIKSAERNSALLWREDIIFVCQHSCSMNSRVFLEANSSIKRWIPSNGRNRDKLIACWSWTSQYPQLLRWWGDPMSKWTIVDHIKVDGS